MSVLAVEVAVVVLAALVVTVGVVLVATPTPHLTVQEAAATQAFLSRASRRQTPN